MIHWNSMITDVKEYNYVSSLWITGYKTLETGDNLRDLYHCNYLNRALVIWSVTDLVSLWLIYVFLRLQVIEWVWLKCIVNAHDEKRRNISCRPLLISIALYSKHEIQVEHWRLSPNFTKDLIYFTSHYVTDIYFWKLLNLWLCLKKGNWTILTTCFE